MEDSRNNEIINAKQHKKQSNFSTILQVNYCHPPKPYGCKVVGDISSEGGKEIERSGEINYVPKQHHKSTHTNPRLILLKNKFYKFKLVLTSVVDATRPLVRLVCLPGT